MNETTQTRPPPPKRKKYVPVVGPRLKAVLTVVFALFAVLSVNSAYLGTIRWLGWATGSLYQTPFYHHMAFGHVVVGALLAVLVIVFGAIHLRNAHDRPNRRAVRAGYALFTTALVVFATGFLLVRLEGFNPVKNPATRVIVYWAHVIAPFVAAWLFVLHRLAGKKIRWKVGAAWAGVALVFAGGMAFFHGMDPRQANVVGPKSGEAYFFPSQARTATGNFIPAQAMLNDKYCLQCHADIHKNWAHSVHRFSSFNNPAYLFSVLQTRKKVFERDGKVNASRFCAGCHDPIPFFSGAFDDKKFDDPNYDLAHDENAQAGITCTVCHSITAINSVKGNASYTIEEAQHYPFAFSDDPVLQWINRQMILSNPEFHKKTFLKPFHKTAEFCATCHKVHLPEELNKYQFLRGQNHYDSFLLSAASGHGITSFHYPPKAEQNCNGCHMPLHESTDFGAKDNDGTGLLKVHNHQFPSANTAVPALVGMPGWVNDAHREFEKGVMRVDLFGVKEGGTTDSPLTAPLRPKVPVLKPGSKYLLETVIRTVKMGHLFTQGTSDSNEVWLDVTVTSDGRVIGRSGGMRPEDGEVDPWSHFVNAFVIDRDGNRIDRRNAEDIFIPLYNHQIGPGAADVVHLLLDVPADVRGAITVEVALEYRKFDATYMKLFQGKDFKKDDLPVMTLATDKVTFPVAGFPGEPVNPDSPTVPWQRWNDYGIGLLLKGDEGSNKGELRQAEAAFREVEGLKRPDGPLNRARVYIKGGRLDEAVEALTAAKSFVPPAPPWSVAWFSGLVNKQTGHLDEAITSFKAILEMKDTAECRERGFDFSRDYRLLNELGNTFFERSKQERDLTRRPALQALLDEAISLFERALHEDPENVDAHYNLAQIYEDMGDAGKAAEHRALYAKYKPDDNARDRAVRLARLRYPAANHAAEAVVIYDLRRPGAYELK